MRDVNAPLSQEYSLPVRLGQQEMRDSVTYRVLTKDMLEDHKKLDMPSNKVPESEAMGPMRCLNTWHDYVSENRPPDNAKIENRILVDMRQTQELF